MSLRVSTNKSGRLDEASGFTLLETLVALLIFSIFSTMVYSGFNSLVMTDTALATASSDIKSVALMFSRMENEVSTVSNGSIRGEEGKSVQPVSGGSTSFEIIVVSPSMEEGTAPFTRKVGYRFTGDSVMVSVTPYYRYRFRTEENEYELVRNVIDFSVRYRDVDNEWLYEWGAEPPKAMEVSVTIYPNETYRRVLYIP